MARVKVKVKNLETDPLGDALTQTEEIEPYLAYYKAAITAGGRESALQRIKDLPTEQRYLWRVHTHLGLALADLDTETARLDIKTMPAERLLTIAEDARFRLSQLRLLVECLEENIATPPSGGSA